MPEYKTVAISNEDFHPKPDWLNTDYVENVLKCYTKDNTVKLTELNIIPATSKGENYASVMFRIRVKFLSSNSKELQSGNFILKMSFEGDEFANEKFSEYDVYKREINIYKNIFPNLKSLLEEAQDHDELVANTIYADYDHNVLIFEDLSVRNFVLAERKNGLDMVHAKMVLNKLAKMHSASAVLSENAPDTFKSYDRGMFNRHTNAFSPFFVNTLVACGNLVKDWKNFEYYSKKIFKLKPVLMEYGKRVFDPKIDHLNVLVHGDLWVNNVMFTYNENKEPTDVLMVDFQFSCWASPAVDLHYFFNTSLVEDLRLYHQDELVEYYYNKLADNLRAMKFKGKIPSLFEFRVQLMEKSFYAFTSACIVQPVQLNENTDNADFAALMGEDERANEFKRIVYTNEKVQKNLKRLLPYFDRRGLLDIQ